MTREEAIDKLIYSRQVADDEYQKEWCEALDMAIKALEQEPSGDLISRQLAIDTMAKLEQEDIDTYGCSIPEGFDGERAIVALKQLPSVNPQEPKTGRWEYVQYDYNPRLGNWHCSECRCVVIECVDKEEKGGIPLYKYCPQCGAKMQEAEIEG